MFTMRGVTSSLLGTRSKTYHLGYQMNWLLFHGLKAGAYVESCEVVLLRLAHSRDQARAFPGVSMHGICFFYRSGLSNLFDPNDISSRYPTTAVTGLHFDHLSSISCPSLAN